MPGDRQYAATKLSFLSLQRVLADILLKNLRERIGPKAERSRDHLGHRKDSASHQLAILARRTQMKLRDLESLVASAAAGNFTRAARSLDINTSTISRRVARLEDELGLAIFERGHAGIRLTAGGKTVLVHARRAIAELEAVKFAARQNGTGSVGEVRVGVRLPPIGDPIRGLLRKWRQNCANVALTISEMNERDLAVALDERRLDVALAPNHMLPTRLARLAVHRERLFVAVPAGHALTRHEKKLSWTALSGETILVQGWDESQAERQLLAPLLGSKACFRSHAASRQSILALVAAGFGIAIVSESQAIAGSEALAFRPVDGSEAKLQLDFAWLPEIEEPAVGRFIAFMRDAVRSRGLV